MTADRSELQRALKGVGVRRATSRKTNGQPQQRPLLEGGGKLTRPALSERVAKRRNAAAIAKRNRKRNRKR